MQIAADIKVSVFYGIKQLIKKEFYFKKSSKFDISGLVISLSRET